MYILIKLSVKTQVIVAGAEIEFPMIVVHATNTPQPFIDAGAEVVMANKFETRAEALKTYAAYLIRLDETYGKIL